VECFVCFGGLRDQTLQCEDVSAVTTARQSSDNWQGESHHKQSQQFGNVVKKKMVQLVG
jgi:hypothetical protein